jgi:hypothetical protein
MPDGTVSLLAGSTSQASGNTDGLGTAAAFNQPRSLYIDNTGTGYVAEPGGNRIRTLALAGYSLNGTLPAGLTFSPTAGTISGTPTATFSAPVSMTAYNTGGFSIVPFALTQVFNWTGAVSSTWSSAANWNPSTRFPAATDRAQIGVVAYATGGFQPVISSTPSSSPNGIIFGTNNSPVLTINSGATLTTTSTANPAGGLIVNTSATPVITGGGSLVLTGTSTINSSGSLTLAGGLAMSLKTATSATLTNTGTFALGSATLGSSASLTLGASTTATNNGTFTIASNGILTLGTSCTVTNNSTFTLLSDQTGSAAIAAIPSSSSVVGQIAVQRYISSDGTTTYRGYRLLSSPVYAAAVSGTNVYSLNYLEIYSYLSGSGGTAGGFDVSGNPTLYIYREDQDPGCNTSFICGPFQGVANINQTPAYNYLLDPYNVAVIPYTQSFNIPVGTGYLFFFRGVRPTTLPFVSSTPPTAGPVVATGLLNQGPISFHYWLNGSTNFTQTPSGGANGFNLVGNPYPCTIDWYTFSSTTSTAGIYGPGVSTQISELNQVTHSYETYDSNTLVGNGEARRYIASGQGFFITALNGTTASLTFNESAKVPSQQPAYGSTLLLSKSLIENNNYQYLRLQMNADSVYGENIMIWFDHNNKMTFEPARDAVYRRGFNKVNLSSFSSDGVELEINKQPLPGLERRVIALNVDATESGTYHFNLKQVVSLPKLYDIWLIDAYKKDSVNLRAKNTYDFTINKSDNASFGASRFSLVINQNPALAYKLLDFTANKLQTARQVQTIWKTQNEENYTNFTLERSTDGGKTFEVLGGVKAAGEGTYSFIDRNPVVGMNLYRLKQEDINNAISYSMIVPIGYSDKGDNLTDNKLTIYPNPVSSTLNLTINQETTDVGTYKVRILSTAGLVVKEITSSSASWQGNVSNLLPGTYLVRVFNNKTQSIVAESKFVKL